MKKITLFTVFFTILLFNFSYAQDKKQLEQECLKLFTDLVPPFSFLDSDKGIQGPPESTLTSKMQDEVLGMGGYNDQGFGYHMGAVGKVKLSDGIYILFYSSLVVPVPGHMDEFSFAIYKEGSYQLENKTDLAHTRGGPGMDESRLTCKLANNGKNLELFFEQKTRKAIQTDDGPDRGPEEIQKWKTTVDSKGKVTEGKKTKVN